VWSGTQVRQPRSDRAGRPATHAAGRGCASPDDHQRQAIAAEVQRILDSADQTLLDQKRESLTDMAARVHAALDGHILEAYTDRSGETRSI
jgi:hypothetical protein